MSFEEFRQPHQILAFDQDIDIAHPAKVGIGIDGKGRRQAFEVDRLDAGIVDPACPFKRETSMESIGKAASRNFFRCDQRPGIVFDRTKKIGGKGGRGQ